MANSALGLSSDQRFTFVFQVHHQIIGKNCATLNWDEISDVSKELQILD
jgi:hypothetical protein